MSLHLQIENIEHMEKIHLKIRRQDSPEGLSYWEEFYVPYEEGMSVIEALRLVGRSPETQEGLPTSPVVWDHNCMQAVCGSCSMIINGKVRLACSTFVEDLDQPIVLEPMSKFPVFRDLRVDRSAIFEHLKEIKPWVEIDSLFDQDITAYQSSELNAAIRVFSECVMCGSCVESCPEVNERSHFAGAFLVMQAYVANLKDSKNSSLSHRMNFIKGPSGIDGCDNTQNCEKVCPKDIPLNKAISHMQWDISKYSLISFLRS